MFVRARYGKFFSMKWKNEKFFKHIARAEVTNNKKKYKKMRKTFSSSSLELRQKISF